MKKYITELIGAFFLTLTIALSGGNALAIGIILAALVYAGGEISGGHYNPAVTLGVYLRKKIDVKSGLFYIGFQALGSLVAALTFFIITGKTFLPHPGTGVNFFSVIIVEALFTFALVFTVLNVATSKKTEGNQYFGFAIGSILLAGIAAGGSISGGVYNPAVGLGTFIIGIFSGASFMNLIIYLIGPFAGGALAGLAYQEIEKLDNKGKVNKDQKEEAQFRKPQKLERIQIILNSLLRLKD